MQPGENCSGSCAKPPCVRAEEQDWFFTSALSPGQGHTLEFLLNSPYLGSRSSGSLCHKVQIILPTRCIEGCDCKLVTRCDHWIGPPYAFQLREISRSLHACWGGVCKRIVLYSCLFRSIHAQPQLIGFPYINPWSLPSRMTLAHVLSVAWHVIGGAWPQFSQSQSISSWSFRILIPFIGP